MALGKTSDSSSIVKLTDILTNPIHNDNSKPVTKYLHRPTKLLAKSSNHIRSDPGDYTKEAIPKQQTLKTHSRREYVPEPSHRRSLRPHHILFRRACMRAGTVLAQLRSEYVPGFAPPYNSYYSNSTILSWLRSGTVAKSSCPRQVYLELAFGSVGCTIDCAAKVGCTVDSGACGRPVLDHRLTMY
jgi:hypothetical protein